MLNVPPFGCNRPTKQAYYERNMFGPKSDENDSAAESDNLLDVVDAAESDNLPNDFDHVVAIALDEAVQEQVGKNIGGGAISYEKTTKHGVIGKKRRQGRRRRRRQRRQRLQKHQRRGKPKRKPQPPRRSPWLLLLSLQQKNLNRMSGVHC